MAGSEVNKFGSSFRGGGLLHEEGYDLAILLNLGLLSSNYFLLTYSL